MLPLNIMIACDRIYVGLARALPPVASCREPSVGSEGIEPPTC